MPIPKTITIIKYIQLHLSISVIVSIHLGNHDST